LKLLMQLIFPTSGRAEILGHAAGHLGVKRRIGYLPENPYFYDYLTAEELLQYFGALHGYSAAERRTRAARLLDEVGVGPERRLQLRKFSKGMLQRVGIAQALVNDPELVFFDEPMSGLDPIGRREIRELILGLRDRGCTVFFSSHVLSDAEALCSRVAIVAGGRLVAQGALSDMLAFQARAWELVVSHVSASTLDRVRAARGVTRVTALGPDRYAIELPLTEAPDRVFADLAVLGAQLVSVNPVRDTLEDFFMRRVAQSPNDRGLQPVA
jgi:ABC-2 type transport system ATP-binding protein